MAAATIEPGAAAIVVAAGLPCALRYRRTSQLPHEHALRGAHLRLLLFAAGAAAYLAAYFGLYQAARSSLVMHEARLLIGGELAGALLALGLVALPAAGRKRPGLLRFPTGPAAAVALWVANLCIWHLQAALEGAIHHPAIGAIEYVCFAAVATNMWLALARRWGDTRGRELGAVLYTAAIRIPGVALANLLLWSGTVFYPWYIHPSVVRQTSPLVDQNVAGAVLLFANVLLALAVLGGAYLSARSRLALLASGHSRAAHAPEPVLDGAIQAARSLVEGSASGAGS